MTKPKPTRKIKYPPKFFRIRPPRLCEYCHQEFAHFDRRKRFCSSACRGIAGRSRIYHCEICRKDFEPPHRTCKLKTCSPECRRVLTFLHWEEKRVKKFAIQATCPVCGKQYPLFNSRRQKRASCSRQCAGKMRQLGLKPIKKERQD